MSALHFLAVIVTFGVIIGTLADVAFVLIRNAARIRAALKAERLAEDDA